MSRTKGAQGEREVVLVARSHGLRAERTAALQSNEATSFADVTLTDFPHVHIEVKRDERLSVDAMRRQAQADAAPNKRIPVVVYRRNKGDWCAVVPLGWLLSLLTPHPRGVE